MVVVVDSKFSDRLWLSFSLALAKSNKISHFSKDISTGKSNKLNVLEKCQILYKDSLKHLHGRQQMSMVWMKDKMEQANLT